MITPLEMAIHRIESRIAEEMAHNDECVRMCGLWDTPTIYSDARIEAFQQVLYILRAVEREVRDGEM